MNKEGSKEDFMNLGKKQKMENSFKLYYWVYYAVLLWKDFSNCTAKSPPN